MRLWWQGRRQRSAAARWFVRMQNGDVARPDDAGLQNWLAHDSARERALEEQLLTWDMAGALEDDPDIRRLLAEAESTTSARQSWLPSPMRAGLVAAVSIGLLIALAWIIRERTAPGDVYRTGEGEERMVVLPDQSLLTLNANTSLRIQYTPARRLIFLEHGESTFKVTHDPARPFEVWAGGGIARALGTEFDVTRDQQQVTVAVLDGRVEVELANRQKQDAASPMPVVLPGQEVSYRGDQLSPVHDSSSKGAARWDNRRVAFQDVSLEAAIHEFNRYAQVQVTIGDSSLNSYRVTGVFRVGETQALLDALKDAFGLRTERDGDVIILRPPQQPSTITGTER